MTITIDSAGNVSPGLTIPVLNSTTINSVSLTLTASVIQQFSGRIRLLTPAGGALVREWADSLAATTGPIEIGVSYNADLNPATGVWAGRDKADVCWLEKWNDVGGLKEFWFAATDAASVVPTWTRPFYIDVVNGRAYSAGGISTNVSAEVAAATYTVTNSDVDLYVNFAGTVTVTLPAAASFPGRYITLRTYQAQLVNSASANVSINGVVGSSILAATAGKWAVLKSDGTNWEVLLNN